MSSEENAARTLWLEKWTLEHRQHELERAFELMYRAAMAGDFEAADIILACAAKDGHERARRLRAFFDKGHETGQELYERIEAWIAKQVEGAL